MRTASHFFWRGRALGASDDRVARHGLAEPSGTTFRRALLRLEVHMDEPEPIAEAVDPFEVVHQAPVEIALYRHSVSGRALELSEIGAQEHNPVRVVHP